MGFQEDTLTSFSLPHQLTQTHSHAQGLSKPQCSIAGIVDRYSLRAGEPESKRVPPDLRSLRSSVYRYVQ